MTAKTYHRRKKDIFGEIGAKHRLLHKEELVEPRPPELPDVFLPGSGKTPRFTVTPRPRIDTISKLARELRRQRGVYAKFMRDTAPGIKTTRSKLFLEAFQLRVQDKADKKDFSRPLLGRGEWAKVKIPHYGGPLGRAVTYYRTTFNLSKSMLTLSTLFVCFKGVDYKAHVFLNGSYLGSHEGFFGPFEFEFTSVARRARNTLVVVVENDAVCMGNESWDKDGNNCEGDKLYAASGPGYDDPEVGWHHCPPGMGIYQDVFVEARANVHVRDVFVRPVLEEGRAEVWIEINNCGLFQRRPSLELSVFGQNFRKTLIRNRKCDIEYAGPGVNYYRLSIDMPVARLWHPDSPWLYQVQVTVLDEKGKTLDSFRRQFGMRSFRMDQVKESKGRLYLNGRPIRLRGANTMGHMQQCVIKKDWNQLRDDILLAKICHVNFFRLTQCPVQTEIYDLCDRLGMMTQTDLPLFGVLRRNQFTEAVKQSGEMERLVRSHPCNIMITYMNERFPNAWEKPQRHLTRQELEDFFAAADTAVRLANPDRVIKPVDGDYDPPAPGLPDNHCYTGWYNGHGVDLGKLHKGYWQNVKPGWFYACGEFGSEGLDPVRIMRKYYPTHWLPQSRPEEQSWTPARIPRAQTARFHYMWFDTQDTVRNWVRASQTHQARMTRLMTAAFRRDGRMNSFAIHLLIDAFPSGWMKAVMDFRRRPKPAWFAYHETLTPLMVNLRTDRSSCFGGEEVCLEAWICNDLNTLPKKTFLRYQVGLSKDIFFSGHVRATVPVCDSRFQGFLRFRVPAVKSRSKVTVRLALVDEKNKVLHDDSAILDVFPAPVPVAMKQAVIVGSRRGKALQLTSELGLSSTSSKKMAPGDVILIDNYAEYVSNRMSINAAVRQGAVAVFIDLAEGPYKLTGNKILVTACGMGPRHFVSRATGNPLVAGFETDDFSFWYDPRLDRISPLISKVFTAPGWEPILTSGNGAWAGDWAPCLAAAEKKYGKGHFRVCLVELAGRVMHNPAANIFARRLLGCSAVNCISER